MVFCDAHLNGLLLQGCTNPQYRKLKFNDMTFVANDNKNNYCRVKGNKIVKIYNIAFHTFDDTFVIIGKEFLKKCDLYKLPCPSSTIGIYEVYDLSVFKVWHIKDIQLKYFSYPISQQPTKMVVVPLHHNE